MGGLNLMIHRVISIGRWIVDFLFVEKEYDDETILSFLYELDASYNDMLRVNRIMDSGKYDCGFTFANMEMKRALVVIGPSSSGGEFLNTFSHEIHHLAVFIAESLGYDLEGEAPAYITGDATLALAETVCELGCSDC